MLRRSLAAAALALGSTTKHHVGRALSSPSSALVTSTSNQYVKVAKQLLTRKGRRKHNLVLIEGRRLIESALAAGCEIETLISSDPHFDAYFPAERIISASERVLKACSDTTTPQGSVALARLPYVEPPKQPDLVLVLDAVSDPGNVGALLRTAAAASVDAAVMVGPETCDPFAPKCLRAAMGATFRLPILYFHDWALAEAHLRDKWGIHSVRAADVCPPSEDEEETSTRRRPVCYPYSAVPSWDRCAVVIGAEVGLSKDIREALDDCVPDDDEEDPPLSRVYIPISRDVDSLNAAVAGSVIMLEARRALDEQRSRVSLPLLEA